MKSHSLMKWNWPDTGLMLVSWFFYFHNKFLKIFEQNIGKLSKLLEKYFSWKMASWSLLSSMSSSKPWIRYILWLFDRCWRLLQKGFISKYSLLYIIHQRWHPKYPKWCFGDNLFWHRPKDILYQDWRRSTSKMRLWFL